MTSNRRFAVIGAGPGGLATAARLAEQGCAVAVHDHDPARVDPVRARGGVDLEGDLGERFVALDRVSTDLDEVLDGANVVLTFVPAFAQAELLPRLLPALVPGSTLVLHAGCGGSLAAAPLLRDHEDVLLGETSTHPQSSRLVGDARVRIKYPSSMRTSALPGRDTGALVERLGDVLAMTATPNVFDPILNNPNFLIHPAPMVLNYGAVERSDWTLSIMNEGMTPGTLRALDVVDAEKMALQRALGLEVLTIDDFYTRAGSGPTLYRAQGEPFGTSGDRIWDRYVTEDVPYGTVIYSSLGAALGVPTPMSDALNAVLSQVWGEDFVAHGRTLEAVGLGGLDREALLRYVETGAA